MQTLFSTEFFNFSDEDRIVSKWFWLYWVVALGLTILCFLIWKFFPYLETLFGEGSKAKMKKMVDMQELTPFRSFSDLASK